MSILPISPPAKPAKASLCATADPSIELLPTLPALKRLGSLADLRPVVVIDSREQDPLPISRLATVRAGLQSADYSFLGAEHLFGVERKSLADLVSCCVGENRSRLERELHRLRGFRFARLLIVGNRWEIEAHQYRSAVKPSVVLNSLAAWEARYIPVVWVDHPTKGAELIEHWTWWFARQLVEDANNLLRGSKTAAQSEACKAQ